ncbi:hypothetical protein QE177_13965 [Arsenophonus sp. aPb]|uniref:hypothetical protein n=1 Tax=Arsenophonus sp. aPb TaxID=3041619 RepID=UPI0024699A0D|nr:hypothetical protein [Arsenophonus sp. aPb]WGL98257.1 hypothetical protein QE177_13965 [Arsenophonus sp. aPb]
MKKTLIALITICIIPSTVLANESKNGVYISAKMGASIQQMSGQFFPTFYILEVGGEEEKFAQKLKGNNHRTAVFGAGFALGYDFYENFNIPIRTELDWTLRPEGIPTIAIQETMSLVFLVKPLLKIK